jgi:hypothetical protein
MTTRRSLRGPPLSPAGAAGAFSSRPKCTSHAPMRASAGRCLMHLGRQSRHAKGLPMFALDAPMAAAIFLSSFFLDLIAARYTSDVVSLRAGRAASLSVVWHLLSAVVVIEYAHNAFYIVFVCLGAGLGTYLTIWSARRAPAPADEGAAPRRRAGSRRGTARRSAASSLRARRRSSTDQSRARVFAAPKAPS